MLCRTQDRRLQVTACLCNQHSVFSVGKISSRSAGIPCLQTSQRIGSPQSSSSISYAVITKELPPHFIHESAACACLYNSRSNCGSGSASRRSLPLERKLVAISFGPIIRRSPHDSQTMDCKGIGEFIFPNFVIRTQVLPAQWLVSHRGCSDVKPVAKPFPEQEESR